MSTTLLIEKGGVVILFFSLLGKGLFFTTLVGGVCDRGRPLSP